MSPAADLYLELLKRSILNSLYAEHEALIRYLVDMARNRKPVDADVLHHPLLRLKTTIAYLDEINTDGRRPHRFAHAMAGRKRLDNVHACLDAIRADGVPGDLLEAGVWRGGLPLFMRGWLKAHGDEQRTVWLADSFAGVPPATHPEDAGVNLSAADIPWIAIPREEVEETFRRYDLLDDRVRMLEGWFKDTLPSAPVTQLALLRVDGDLYESTMDALTALYDRVAPGGFVIIDDYGDIPACRRAVDQFRAARGIEAPITAVDWTGAFWRKA